MMASKSTSFALAAVLLAFTAPAFAASPAADPAARVVTISTHGQSSHQRLTLSLDKAAIVQLDVDAKDVLVSNPDIVDAVVRTPRRIFLLASKVGQTNAFFFDNAGRQILSLDVRVEKDVMDLGTLMKTALPNSDIQVQALNDNVVLTGTVTGAGDATRAADLAARFAGDPKKVVNMITIAGGQQVMLKVRIAEMDRSIAKQFGVDLSSAATIGGVPVVAATSNPYGLLGRALSDLSGTQIGSACSGQVLSQATAAMTSSVTNPLITSTTQISTGGLKDAAGNVIPAGTPLTTTTYTGGGLPTVTNTLNSSHPVCPNNAQGIMKALEQVGLVHMLAEPNLTAVSGETAKFLAGGEFPVPASKDAQGNVTVDFKPFGVGLSFTPVVLSPGRISLQLSSEVSELTNTGSFTLAGGTTVNSAGQTVTAPGLTIPALSVRRAQTTVELPSGGSFAVAGLMQHVTKQVIDGFPALKDMPVLGALFRSRDFENDETELVVLVSAYLVQPGAEKDFVSPTDGFVAPTDPETLLLGRLNAVYKKGDKPVTPVAGQPVGYVVE